MNTKREMRAAHHDFDKIKLLIHEICSSDHCQSLRLHADYHIGQVKCLQNIIFIELIDLTEIGKGVWLQARNQDNDKIVQIRASCKRNPSYTYINTLIAYMHTYANTDVLSTSLHLRPFGTNYIYKKGPAYSYQS